MCDLRSVNGPTPGGERRPRARLERFAALALAAAVALALVPSSPAALHRARAWRLLLPGPAQFDLSLTRVRFGQGRGALGRHRRLGLRLSLAGPAGLDYVAAALSRRQPRGQSTALIMIVNERPRGSLAPDLQAIALGARLSRASGRTLISSLNPFGHPAPAPASLCAPAPRGPLSPAGLKSLVSAGRALPGFSPEEAVAQAFDVVCGRPYDARFRLAVTMGCPTPAGCSAPPPACPPPCGARGLIPCPEPALAHACPAPAGA